MGGKARKDLGKQRADRKTSWACVNSSGQIYWAYLETEKQINIVGVENSRFTFWRFQKIWPHFNDLQRVFTSWSRGTYKIYQTELILLLVPSYVFLRVPHLG